MRPSRLATTLAALGCAAALTLGACGGDDDESPTTTATTAAQPDLERYCELVAELDQSSNEIFQEIGATGVPTEEDLAEAQLRVLEENAALIDELSVVVPDEIREDFELSVESARERAETGDATEPPKAVAQAGLRLRDFRDQNCPEPQGQGG